MIPAEDMLSLAYKCHVHKSATHTALIFSKSEYNDFVQHYSFFLKLMNYSMADDEFRNNLQNLTVAYELK